MPLMCRSLCIDRHATEQAYCQLTCSMGLLLASCLLHCVAIVASTACMSVVVTCCCIAYCFNVCYCSIAVAVLADRTTTLPLLCIWIAMATHRLLGMCVAPASLLLSYSLDTIILYCCPAFASLLHCC